MQLKNDERLESAVEELNLWVRRLNEVYGAWQVGWAPAEERLRAACGEIAVACQRLEEALTPQGAPQRPEGPAIDLSELQSLFGE